MSVQRDRAFGIREAGALVDERPRPERDSIGADVTTALPTSAGAVSARSTTNDERMERWQRRSGRYPRERVVAERAEHAPTRGGDEHRGHHAAVERGQAAGPVAHALRGRRRGRDRSDDQREPEATRDRGGEVRAADERDERAAEPEQAAERADGRDALAAPGGPVTEAARVHRLRERDGAFHAALEHRDGVAHEPAAAHDHSSGPGPVGLARRAERGERRRDERERDRDDQPELVERARCRLQHLVMRDDRVPRAEHRDDDDDDERVGERLPEHLTFDRAADAEAAEDAGQVDVRDRWRAACRARASSRR